MSIRSRVFRGNIHNLKDYAMKRKKITRLLIIIFCLCWLISVFGETKTEILSEEEETLARKACQQGHIYMDNKQYDEAIAAFTKAIEINPVYTEAYTNRGIAYQEKGKFDEAMLDYTKVIEIEPNAPAYTNRAIIYFERGDYDKAISDCDKAIEIAPRSGSNAYIIRGSIYNLKGNFDQANTDFTKVIGLYPQEGSNYYDRARIYFNPLRRNPRGFSAEGGSASGGSPGMNAVDSIFASGRKPRTLVRGGFTKKTIIKLGMMCINRKC
jgi:tetratricopeptide (TPR) repeat protein